MKKNNLITLLKYAAIAGNILFILWVSANGLKEGFRGTIYEKISWAGLICILTINSILILNKEKQTKVANQQKAN